MTISELKLSLNDSPKVGLPLNNYNLYFCYLVEWDFDGPDYMGPPISDIIKTYYAGEPVLALVYSVKDGGAKLTGRNCVSLIRKLEMADSSLVVLMDKDSGLVEPVLSIYTCWDMMLFLSKSTQRR